MVEFCDNCGAILIGKKGENVVCPGCGKQTKTSTEAKLTEKINVKSEKEIVQANIGMDINPITEVECPKCKHMEAYYWTKQTRAGDEPETQFFKCVKCSHQWRDYR